MLRSIKAEPNPRRVGNPTGGPPISIQTIRNWGGPLSFVMLHSI